jgi:hypothetical protein
MSLKETKIKFDILLQKVLEGKELLRVKLKLYPKLPEYIRWEWQGDPEDYSIDILSKKIYEWPYREGDTLILNLIDTRGKELWDRSTDISIKISKEGPFEIDISKQMKEFELLKED